MRAITVKHYSGGLKRSLTRKIINQRRQKLAEENMTTSYTQCRALCVEL